ncbi:MAG: chromosome segregation protein SMC [Thermoplasmatales archaeon]|nr:MAG: chromosome segregation protein SMC [Thermoplasmatales archaeon]
MELYLKEVQMENFKSFGKKLVVPFFPGFTAITGPNGSGKSNIVDAILFVLGPKSSKVMRAGRLTDLIFNGGKKHKNPAKFCKVSLVFDNSQRKMPVDSDEVVLTRMIRRAPLKDDPDNYYSYFYINNRSASYSKFVDVLTHARISGDGYNIVKQGDVTSLVKMGSVDRRRIIDDVAGISTFDSDIKKAEVERGDVEKNLERIKIILNEITSQTRQLKKDRDAAYRYKEQKDKLYETKAKIAHKKKREVENQIVEINRQIESYETEQKGLEIQRKVLKKQHTDLLQDLEGIEKKIGDAGGDESKEIKEKIDSLRTEEIKLEEKINYSKDEIFELKNEKKELELTVGGITKELEELQSQNSRINNQIKEQQEKLDKKEKNLSELKDEIAQSDDTSMELTRELVKMREEYNEKQSEIHEFKLKRDRLNDNIDALGLQIAEMQETKSAYEFELKDIDWQSDEFHKDTKESSKKIRDLEKQIFQKKKKESELTEQQADLEKAILKLQREQSKLQAEYDALQSVHAKYNQAVNAILRARDSGELKGICGTVAELAQVGKQYETSLEIAAGPRMQSIVVDDDVVAAEAIRFLAARKLGRATFLPLNKMIVGKPRAKALMAVKDEHSHGFAFDLVKFNDEYKGAFWYVFGDTVIVDTLNDARRLMGGVRLVGMKGNLIEASGAMIGGSTPKTHLSFGNVDRNKLDELTRQLHTTIESQDLLSEELASLKKEIAELESNLGSFKAEIDQRKQVPDLDVRKKEYKGKLEVLTKDLEAKMKEKTGLNSKKSEIVKTITEYETRLEELNLQKEEKGKHLLKTSKKELAREVRDFERKVSELQENLLKLRSEQETLQKKIELISEKKVEISQKMESNDAEIEEFKSSIQGLEESRAHHKDELKALMTVEEQMTGKAKEFVGKRDEIYKKTVSVENELDKINTRSESYIDLISRSKYRLPTLDGTLKELDQEIALYNVEITDKKLPNIESLKESIRVIEESMRELEPVNMRALEEYEHQIERKKKFNEDILHLKDQKKNLIKLVKEVTSKKKERFFEIFDEINKNFKSIYSQLSEGGEAELLLENEEHIFDHGLTIKARPHGKKVLRLPALSGGEKSIASLAFIFAIQQYDPSPFYVLDEIDMFLDGVNAETVSRMIKQNASHSQFINVSLRKIAIKEANHVYGVTMHDSGISEMIGNIDPESVGPKGEIPTVRGV